MKLMFVGAHPDDGEGRVGGLAARYIKRGGEALFVSVSNENAGHHEMEPHEPARRRKGEAPSAGEVIGAEYVVLDHDDARLVPTLAIREELIGMIRQFRPDLLITVRPFDYHPDHRAAGQLVVDASYLLTVPLVRPDVPIMRRMPVICYSYDGFRKPLPFECSAVVAVDEYTEAKVHMLAAHESQMFEWLPFNGGYLEEVPDGREERLEWLRGRLEKRFAGMAEKFRAELTKRYGPARAAEVRDAEVFEVCEYGRKPTPETLVELLPA